MSKLERKAGKSEYLILRAKKMVMKQLKLDKFEKFEKDIFEDNGKIDKFIQKGVDG